MQVSARRRGVASPAPPVKTNPSIPPIAAHMAATLVWIRYTYTSYASRARRVPGTHGGDHAPQIARPSREPSQPRLVLQRLLDFIDRQTSVMLNPQNDPGVDAARACCHDQTLQGREPHRGVDRATEGHRSQRPTGTEVGCDQAQLFSRPAQELPRPPAGPGVAEPMKAVAPDAPTLTPRPRYCIRRCLGRHGGMEGRVETGNLGQVGSQGSQGVDGGKTLRIVQGSQIGETS